VVKPTPIAGELLTTPSPPSPTFHLFLTVALQTVKSRIFSLTIILSIKRGQNIKLMANLAVSGKMDESEEESKRSM
jgi:hypothetical protein